MAKQNPNQFKFCCVALNKKGHVIAMSFQQAVKTHPLQYQYAKKVNLIEKIYLHAEISTLIKADNPFALIIIRVDSFGKMVNSKPCPICQLAISNTSTLKEVYYTKDNAVFKLESS